MITREILLQKTKYYIKLNHIDKISNDNEHVEIMWWIIENKLSEEKQMMLIYNMFFIKDENDKNDTNLLFHLSRRQFYATIKKIGDEIKDIWKQF